VLCLSNDLRRVLCLSFMFIFLCNFILFIYLLHQSLFAYLIAASKFASTQRDAQQCSQFDVNFCTIWARTWRFEELFGPTFLISEPFWTALGNIPRCDIASGRSADRSTSQESQMDLPSIVRSRSSADVVPNLENCTTGRFSKQK
jgi:hypothetical protein